LRRRGMRSRPKKTEGFLQPQERSTKAGLPAGPGKGEKKKNQGQLYERMSPVSTREAGCSGGSVGSAFIEERSEISYQTGSWARKGCRIGSRTNIPKDIIAGEEKVQEEELTILAKNLVDHNGMDG